MTILGEHGIVLGMCAVRVHVTIILSSLAMVTDNDAYDCELSNNS